VALEVATDETQRGRVLLNLGAIANVEGDLEAARAHYIRSRNIFQQATYVRGEALALHNIGMLHADQSSWDEAEEAYRRCLELLETAGDRQMIANVLLNRSEVSCARERFDDAVANCDLALSIYSEIGDEVGRGEAMRWKGHALVRFGRFADGDRALNDALRIARRSQVKLLEAEAARDLAASRRQQGDAAGARKVLTRALALFEELGAQREIADAQSELARLPQ
jgi:tetratricopeptide (TPR) repeat protein